jgi:hypothetical protein
MEAFGGWGRERSLKQRTTTTVFIYACVCLNLSIPPLNNICEADFATPQNRVDSPRLASIGGQSKKLKISTFGWGW